MKLVRLPRLADKVFYLGWYGLAAAKQYHSTFPDDSLVVYDSQSSIGGTWAEERLYPDLKSNHLLGSYEYPDFPMQPIATSLKIGKDHIPGPIIHSYLNAYASHFSIDLCIRLKTKVTAAEHQNTENGGWVLSLVVDNKESQILARRLIVATGLTSEPIVRSFTGQDVFGGPVFHGKEFPQNKNTLQEKQSVTILGGSKFAWDAAYSYAKSGVEVHWVISGTLLSIRICGRPQLTHHTDSVWPWPVLDDTALPNTHEGACRESFT